jgi:hypothetical protein
MGITMLSSGISSLGDSIKNLDFSGIVSGLSMMLMGILAVAPGLKGLLNSLSIKNTLEGENAVLTGKSALSHLMAAIANEKYKKSVEDLTRAEAFEVTVKALGQLLLQNPMGAIVLGALAALGIGSMISSFGSFGTSKEEKQEKTIETNQEKIDDFKELDE